MSNGGRMEEGEVAALRRVVEYLHEEAQDYEGQGRPTGHVWEAVQTLAAYLEGLRCLYCKVPLNVWGFCERCMKSWEREELGQCTGCGEVVLREQLTYTDNTDRDYCADCHNRLAYPEAE